MLDVDTHSPLATWNHSLPEIMYVCGRWVFAPLQPSFNPWEILSCALKYVKKLPMRGDGRKTFVFLMNAFLHPILLKRSRSNHQQHCFHEGAESLKFSLEILEIVRPESHLTTPREQFSPENRPRIEFLTFRQRSKQKEKPIVQKRHFEYISLRRDDEEKEIKCEMVF